MRNKLRNRRFGGALTGLILLAVLILVFVKPRTFSGNAGKQILLTQPEKIDQIHIAGPLGSVELSRLGEDWMLPGGEKAIPVAVENILFAAGRLQVDAVQTDLSDWEGEDIKELHFFYQQKPVLQYEAMSRAGRFVILPEGSATAYAVSLPGYPELELNQVFSEEENHYMDHLLMDLLPEEIYRVQVELKGRPPFSFSRDEAGAFSFKLHTGSVSEGTAPDDVPGGQELNHEALRMLFTYFRSIRFEEKAGAGFNLLTEEERKDRWMGTVSVETTGGEEHSLEVCSLPGENREEAHMFLALVFHNSSPDGLLVKYVYLDVLMRDFPAYFGDNSLRQ